MYICITIGFHFIQTCYFLSTYLGAADISQFDPTIEWKLSHSLLAPSLVSTNSWRKYLTAECSSMLISSVRGLVLITVQCLFRAFLLKKAVGRSTRYLHDIEERRNSLYCVYFLSTRHPWVNRVNQLITMTSCVTCTCWLYHVFLCDYVIIEELLLPCSSLPIFKYQCNQSEFYMQVLKIFFFFL